MSQEKESLKSVRVELIPELKHGAPTEPYRMLDKIRNKHHHSTLKAKIALAWRTALKPDRDGHLILGTCHKTSDLQKELAEYDFVILLNRGVWEDKEFTKEKKYALLDHELCHAASVYNKSGKHKKDERGRRVYRMRGHDVEEFHEIVERHGMWKRDLEVFAAALLKKRRKERK